MFYASEWPDVLIAIIVADCRNNTSKVWFSCACKNFEKFFIFEILNIDLIIKLIIKFVYKLRDEFIETN